MATQTLTAVGTGFTSRDFRAALGAFATGVTVVTTRGDAQPYGMTANAFSSVSLDPPLVLVCVHAAAEGATQIASNGVFAVNILGAHQEPLSRYFASKDRPRGADAFAEVPHSLAYSGSPILDGVAGYLDCDVHAIHEAGDHQIVLGEVGDLQVLDDAEPLLFHRGRYRLVQGGG